jgi:sugar/nucleoside kinase (ribokinase family)
VFANEDEARSFTGKESKDALIQISDKCEIAVVKIGKDGSYIKSDNTIVKIHPRLSKCIDTTGAGDLYAAGFLYGLACGYNHELCGKIGSLVSGKVVEVIGAKMPEYVWEYIQSEIKLML